MKHTPFVFGFCAILLLDTLGQISFKIVADDTAPIELTGTFFQRLVEDPWCFGIILSALGWVVVYNALLRSAPVGPLFAAAHMDVVLIVAISVLYFQESLSAKRAFGCVAIVCGVLVLAATEGSRPIIRRMVGRH